MPKNLFRQDAVAVAQVVKITPASVIVGQEYGLKVNDKILSVKATSTNPAALISALIDVLGDTQIPEYLEFEADSREGALWLTGTTLGKPFKVTSISGGFETDEYQLIKLSNEPEGGTFPLVYQYYDELGLLQTDETSELAITIDGPGIQAELEGLDSVGTGNVVVTGPAGGPWYAHFKNDLARSDVLPLLTRRGNLIGGNAELRVGLVRSAVAGTSETQRVTCYGTATGGNRSFNFDSASFTVPHNASPAAVQTAARAIATINGVNVDVTGVANDYYDFTFKGALAHRALPLIKVDSTGLTGGSIYAEVQTIVQGLPAVNSKLYISSKANTDVSAQVGLRFTATPTAGLFDLTFGSITVSIPWNATNNDIADLIEAAAGRRGCYVSGGLFKTIVLSGDINIFNGGWGNTAPTVSSMLVGGTVSVYFWNSGSASGGYTSALWSIGNGGGQLLERDASLALIQGELDAQYGVGNSIVSVAVPSNGTWPGTNNGLRGNNMLLVEFTGDLAGREWYLVINSFGDSDRVVSVPFHQGSSSGGVSEVQRLTVHGTPVVGDLMLMLDGQTTAPLAYNSTALACKSAVVALPNIDPEDLDTINGSLPGTPVDFLFKGKYGYKDVTQLVVDDNGLKARVVRTTPGVSGANEVQRLSLARQNIWGGTLALNYDGDSTAGVGFNAQPADVVAALAAATGSADFSASGPGWPEQYIDVEFINTLSETNVPEITGDTTNLLNSDVLVTSFDPLIVDTVTPATGPNHWNDHTNWTLGRVPNWGDDVDLSQGEVDILYGLRQVTQFTADTLLNQILPAGCDFVDGQVVRVWTSGTLPAGLAANTDYYVINIDSITGKFQLTAAPQGNPVDLTSAGSGTLFVGVRLASFTQEARYTGSIGLPQWNESDYWEYRPRYLAIGLDPAGSKLVTLGQGDGSGSGLIRLDLGQDQVVIEQLRASGSEENQVPAVCILNTNSSSVVTVYQGDLGIAFFTEETSVIDALNVRGGRVVLGDVTLEELDQTGGDFKTKDGVYLNGRLRRRT